jgi:hypothetical protein
LLFSEEDVLQIEFDVLVKIGVLEGEEARVVTHNLIPNRFRRAA